MKRTPLRRKTPLGRRARERVRAGGKLAVGRPSATLPEYRVIVARARERANHRCERCGSRAAVDAHHVRRRSRGGADHEDNLVILCRWICHRQTDVSYRDGRLLVAALGGGRFCFRLVHALHKGAPQRVLAHAHTPTASWLAAQGRPTTAAADVSGCSVA